jgi:hypothetical protein
MTLGANKKEDDSVQKRPGMDEAFRQLEALNSLDDPEEYVPPPAKIKLDTNVVWDQTTVGTTNSPETSENVAAASVSLEQDFAVYRDMAQELELNEEAAAYAEVVAELGNSALQTNDTYSQVLYDLGGTTTGKPKTASTSATTAPPSVLSLNEDSVNVDPAATEAFMEEALQEALQEVQINNPRVASSILDNQEIMREIETIFDQGNAKLLASLEEIRQEQVTCMGRYQWPSEAYSFSHLHCVLILDSKHWPWPVPRKRRIRPWPIYPRPTRRNGIKTPNKAWKPCCNESTRKSPMSNKPWRIWRRPMPRSTAISCTDYDAGAGPSKPRLWALSCLRSDRCSIRYPW